MFLIVVKTNKENIIVEPLLQNLLLIFVHRQGNFLSSQFDNSALAFKLKLPHIFRTHFPQGMGEA